MCGICGIVSVTFPQPIDEDALLKMTQVMKHRGPDEQGFYSDEHAGLGSRRLSIIDLAGGRQPIANEDESMWIVYNGEIYNLGLESYQDFLLEGQPAAGPQLVRLQKLADYIQEHTSSSDYIYYWSGDVQLYYLSDRRCPVDIIWPLYAEATGSYQRIFVPQTKYVILGTSFSRSRPDWLYSELAEKYTLEKVIDEQEIYHRVDHNQ
jgi:hypothetical protein